MASQNTAPPQADPSSNPPPSSSEPPNPASSSSQPSPNPSNTPASAPPKTPRLQALQAKQANLETTLQSLQASRATLASKATLPSGLAPLPTSPPLTDEETLTAALQSSNSVIKAHIAQLHAYNEIKDVGQGLMGLIAEKKGCRVREVMEEMGMGEGD